MRLLQKKTAVLPQKNAENNGALVCSKMSADCVVKLCPMQGGYCLMKKVWHVVWGISAILWIGAAQAQYMGCPETLTGVCPPPFPITDTASTSQKSSSLSVKLETVKESMLDTTQTIEKQELLSGGLADLTGADVSQVPSPTPTDGMSSTKEGEEPIDNPTKSVVAAEQEKMVSDAGTLESINHKKLEDAYERQSETIDMLANVLFLKSQLADLKKMADKIEAIGPAEGEASDENLNAAFRGNAALRVVWSQLLTYKQQVLALRLKHKALDMRRQVGELTTPIIETDAVQNDAANADKTI